MPLRPRRVPAERHVVVALAGLRRPLPARPGRPEDGVDRRALDRRRELVLDDEVLTNVLTINATDPKSGTAEFKATAIRVDRLQPGEEASITRSAAAQAH